MHSYGLSILLNHSIIIAAVIAIIRFKNIDPSFYPFIVIIWLGLLNESVSLLLIYTIRDNTVNSNIFVLLEYLLVLVQFYRWNHNDKRRYLLLGCCGLLVWIADNLVLHSINQNNSLFRILYSFIIIFLSMEQLRTILKFKKELLYKNATFIICSTFLFYYGCKAFAETFNEFRFSVSHLFLSDLWITLYFVNFIANLLYATALLCIPTKQEFTLPY